MLRSALLFIPHDPDTRKWMVAVWGYCVRRGLRPEAVAHQWCDALKLWVPGMSIVVPRRDHASWLEVVSEETEDSSMPERQRPRRIPEERQ